MSRFTWLRRKIDSFPLLFRVCLVVVLLLSLVCVHLAVNFKSETNGDKTVNFESVVDKDAKQGNKGTDGVESMPSTFISFRAQIKVTTKDPKGKQYAIKQLSQLCTILNTVPSVDKIEVIKLEGGYVEESEEKFVELETNFQKK